jgi:hypothetical protein
MFILYTLAAVAYLAVGCVVAIFCVSDESEPNRIKRLGSFLFYLVAWGPVFAVLIGWLAVGMLLAKSDDAK